MSIKKPVCELSKVSSPYTRTLTTEPGHDDSGTVVKEFEIRL